MTQKRTHSEVPVSVVQGDYHDLSGFEDKSFNGVYAMETFVRTGNATQALREFYRVLEPGGVLVLHEYAYSYPSNPLPRTIQTSLRLGHAPNVLLAGRLEEMVQGAGFVDVELEDLTEGVRPFARFFGVVGWMPYQIFKVFGIRERFANVMGGTETWLNWGGLRYVVVRDCN